MPLLDKTLKSVPDCLDFVHFTNKYNYYSKLFESIQIWIKLHKKDTHEQVLNAID